MLLKKIKIQIPTTEHLFTCTATCIFFGSLLTYFLDMEIFIGTLCTSLVLLINMKLWIIVVKRLVIIVAQTAEKVLNENEENLETDLNNQEEVFSEPEEGQDLEGSHLDTNSNESTYVPNTGGVHLFFFLKIVFLTTLLTFCGFVFSPLCIIFSNTIIVFSLLFSSIRVIYKA